MILKPSKSELREKELAAKANRPYQKSVIHFVRTCPFCDFALGGQGGNPNGYQCKCSSWRYNYVTSKLERQELNGEAK